MGKPLMVMTPQNLKSCRVCWRKAVLDSEQGVKNFFKPKLQKDPAISRQQVRP